MDLPLVVFVDLKELNIYLEPNKALLLNCCAIRPKFKELLAAVLI